MFGKVRRPTTHRGDGSAKVGLSDGRLALVQQYMVEIEGAGASTQAQAASDEARLDGDATAQRGKEAPAAAAPKRAPRKAVGQERIRKEKKASRPNAPPADAPRRPTVDETPQPGRATAVTNGASPTVEQTAEVNGRHDAREEARARKELLKADKSAAKQAAREMAALEKKEARERRALAKAAARRR